MGGTCATVVGSPPSTGTFLRLFSSKNPTQAPSGEKNGATPSSAPRSGSKSTASKARLCTPSPGALKSSVRPSGESATSNPALVVVSGPTGTGKANRLTGAGAGTGAASRPAVPAAAATTTQAAA